MANGELHVTVGIREELGQFRLLGQQLDRLAGQDLEKLSRPGQRPRAAGGHDLGQLVKLGEGLALGDALGAESHLDAHAERGQAPLHQRRHPGVDGAAQDQELAVGAGMGPVLRRPPARHGGRG